MVKKLPSMNQFLVSKNVRGQIAIEKLQVIDMSEDEAVNLAAWLIALAGPEAKDKFDALYSKVAGAW